MSYTCMYLKISFIALIIVSFQKLHLYLCIFIIYIAVYEYIC